MLKHSFHIAYRVEKGNCLQKWLNDRLTIHYFLNERLNIHFRSPLTHIHADTIERCIVMKIKRFQKEHNVFFA